MGTRGTRVARASVLATAATAIAAATALAVTPPAGTFDGSTGQTTVADPAVTVVTKPNGRVKKFVVHQWRAFCQTGNSWTETTRTRFSKKPALPQDGDHFHGTAHYKSDGGSGYVGHVTATVRGHFPDASHAKGKFNITMTVTRNGNYIDTCSLKAHWKAHS